MSPYPFIEQVKRYFQYLTDDYGFSIVEERYEPGRGGRVRFQSDTVVVTLILDRANISVDISSQIKPDYSFDSILVAEFLVPEFDDSARVCNVRWDYGIVDQQIARDAQILREYCVPMLTGEFSQWKELKEYGREKARRIYKDLTGDDLDI
ncbi:MAG: hypothetical protein JXA14_09220 [Anaerolineae bacterium]|nr:hypothetical protein [Anaerolineae bacterium]